jgi:Tol biopolymer transport system component
MKNLHIYLLMIGFMFFMQKPVQAQNGQQLFQKGLIQEEGEGNLTEAIGIYNSIVNDVDADRELRAKALLHVGICYEKLGNQKARKSYQKLISEYSDQKAIAAVGLEKLSGLKKPAVIEKKEGITASQLWSEAQDTYGVSPDGRYLNYIDWANISINLKDLQNGTTTVLSKVGTWEKPYQFPDKSIWSPDGKKLAYYWFVGDSTELHIVDKDSGSDKIIAKAPNQSTPWPVSWTPDGKYILAITAEKTKNTVMHKMVQVDVDNGAVKILKDFKNVTCGGSIQISPDKKYIAYDLQQNENSKQNDIHILSMDGNTDIKLISNLANDISPIWSPDGKELLFMSDRYGTNDLWKIQVENGKAVGKPRLVKSDLGNGKRVLLGISTDKSIYYVTDNSRIDVYITEMNGATKGSVKDPLKISAHSTKRNMNAVWSPNGQLVAYSRFEPFRDEYLGHPQKFTIYDSNTNTHQDLDTDMYGNTVMYNPQWSLDNKDLLIHGMIKDNYQGGLFLLDINTGKNTAQKVSENVSVDAINDLNRSYTYSNDNKSIFYFSEDRKSIIKYDIKSKKETKILTGTETLLYYVLSNDNSRIAFGYWFENNNQIFVVAASGGEKEMIFDAGTDCGFSPNVLSWGKDDKYLYFKEGEFRNLQKINRIAINDGNPEEVLVFKDIFENGIITQVDIHPDENSLLVELEVGKKEVWKLEGLFSE